MKLQQNNKKKFIYFKNNNIFKNNKGFSLIEVLLVIVIFSIIASVISVVYINSVRSQKDLINKADSEINIRTALYALTKELREASNFSLATNNQIKFSADINNDSALEDVEYILTGTNNNFTLYKKINNGNNKFILGNIINNDIFSYYNDNNSSALQTPLSSNDLLTFKMIKINFTVNKEPTIPSKAVNFSTVVTLRNR